MRHKIQVSKASDREAIITILAMNGYTVRQGKIKNGSRTVYFIEYWEEKADA